MLAEANLIDSLQDFTWFYRGVPEESPELRDVVENGEVRPRRPGNVGEYARYCHSINEMTDTGYTSWTIDRGIAEELARFASEQAGLSGAIVIFRVRIDSIDDSRVFEGLAGEDEYLVEGIVEGVAFSEGVDDDNDE